MYDVARASLWQTQEKTMWSVALIAFAVAAFSRFAALKVQWPCELNSRVPAMVVGNSASDKQARSSVAARFRRSRPDVLLMYYAGGRGGFTLSAGTRSPKSKCHFCGRLTSHGLRTAEALKHRRDLDQLCNHTTCLTFHYSSSHIGPRLKQVISPGPKQASIHQP